MKSTMQKSKSLICLFLLFITLIISCTKSQKGRRPNQNFTFDGKKIDNIIYGRNTDYFGVTEDLGLNIYQSKAVVDGQINKLPLIVYVHGGGFLVGGRSGGDNLMEMMTAKGFIGASIDYRLGWDRNRDGTDPCSGDSTQLKLAIYRAIQDIRASLRFLVNHADEYHIDTNWIFISGASAGGVTVENTTYVDQALADVFLPQAKSTLGYLDSATNNLKNKFTVKGIGSLWGGLNTDEIINASNAIPTIFFHGQLDNVVPYDIGTVYECPAELSVYGSKPIYNKLRALGVPAVAHIDPNGGHGVYDDTFISDNMACFFNNLIAQTPQSGFYFNRDGNCN